MNLLTEEMKLEAVVVTEAVAEEEESRRAFAKTVHMTALQAHTKPMQPTRSSTGSCRTKGENPLIFTECLFSLAISWALWSKTKRHGLETELQMVSHRDEYIKPQKTTGAGKQLWMECV